jgi:peptide-methionine (S)-S-oxide reductase
MMRSFFLLIFAAVLFTACAQKQTTDSIVTPVAAVAKTTATANEAVATFAEGCFWHTEIVFQSLVGVRDAVSGYAGGDTNNPDYESIGSGNTGHAEAVQVFYDPSVISYETLVKAFFASHDPTTLNRQGNDEGSQYRSIAFYNNEKEKKIIEAEISQIAEHKLYGSDIVTEVKPLSKFYKAEDYHQEYISQHPENSYVQHVSIPDFQHFRSSFKGNFKE